MRLNRTFAHYVSSLITTKLTICTPWGLTRSQEFFIALDVTRLATGFNSRRVSCNSCMENQCTRMSLRNK